MKSISVLIADDHALVRAGIRVLLEKIDGVTVVGEAGKGSEAMELAGQLNPHEDSAFRFLPMSTGWEVFEQRRVHRLPPESILFVQP